MEPAFSVKDFAGRIAAAASESGGRELLFLLRAASLLNWPASPVPEGAAAPGANEAADRVGIWRRKAGTEPPVYIRSVDRMSEWSLWANIGRIGPKAKRRRVVFLGESVARGWFYQPHYTPAGVLQELLDVTAGRGLWEVVDLARTNLSLEVRELALQAAQLQPDAVIVFSGNNWRPTAPTIDNIMGLQVALRENGVYGLKSLFEAQVSEAAKAAVRDICEFYARLTVPVIWIVPESNLLDWRDWRVNAARLEGDANREWICCAQKAEAALLGERRAEAAAHARRMIELDGGTGSYGWRLLAECENGLGDPAQERGLFEAARDARIWDLSHLSAPRPYSVSQQAIRLEAGRCGCPVVDLPKVFADYTSGQLPGRRLFHDYCHLTDEGIRVSMAAVATALLRVTSGKVPDFGTLLGEAPLPSAPVAAEASFLAAIHNAHWWQPRDIVQYHCEAAFSKSAHVAQVMAAFVDLQTSSAPMLLSSSAESLAKLSQQSTQEYILRHSTQLLDPVLIDAIADVLEKVEPGARRRISARLAASRGLGREPCSLLDFYYLSAGSQAHELAWAIPGELNDRHIAVNDFYRAYWVESNFAFVSHAGMNVELEIDLRLPGSLKEEAVHITVNGVKIASLRVGSAWKAFKLTVHSDQLLDGVNKVVVCWPIPCSDSYKMPRDGARCLTTWAPDALFQSFGEIHRLIAHSIS